MHYSLRMTSDKFCSHFKKIFVTASEGTSDGSGSHENLKDVGAIQIARPPVNPYER